MSFRALLLALLLLAGAGLVGSAHPQAARAEDEGPKGPEIGRPAPDFRLNDQDGKAVRLTEYGKGHWTVVAFFPKADTPG